MKVIINQSMGNHHMLSRKDVTNPTDFLIDQRNPIFYMSEPVPDLR
jgi:hypothetical protein